MFLSNVTKDVKFSRRINLPILIRVAVIEERLKSFLDDSDRDDGDSAGSRNPNLMQSVVFLGQKGGPLLDTYLQIKNKNSG